MTPMPAKQLRLKPPLQLQRLSMQIYQVELDSDLWLHERRGKVTGTKAKGMGYQARNKTKRYAEFYKVLAEKMSIAADGEDVRDRGHRLEKEAVGRLARERNLLVEPEPGMWISDVDEDIALSPDAYEAVTDEQPLPTWAIEVKALASEHHLRFILQHRELVKRPDYNPIMSVPCEQEHNYKDQAVQYFVVNEKLDLLYFVLYDDRIVFDHLVMLVIEIHREDVADLVRQQTAVEFEALSEINKLVKQLTEVQ